MSIGIGGYAQGIAFLPSIDGGAAVRDEGSPTASRNDIQALADRVAVLEQRDRETAELLTRVSTHVAALTTAGEVLEARARWLLVVAIAASVMSVLACGVALFAR
jgi:hypothetical protein